MKVGGVFSNRGLPSHSSRQPRAVVIAYPIGEGLLGPLINSSKGGILRLALEVLLNSPWHLNQALSHYVGLLH